MTAQPALVVETEHGDGDDGPPPVAPDVLLQMFRRAMELVTDRGPYWKAGVDAAWMQTILEFNQIEEI